jgi:hypothetical protein
MKTGIFDFIDRLIGKDRGAVRNVVGIGVAQAPRI